MHISRKHEEHPTLQQEKISGVEYPIFSFYVHVNAHLKEQDNSVANRLKT